MRTARFFYFTLIFLLTAALFLPSSFAQDYTRWHLPEGAIARFGKGRIYDFEFLPDGNRLAVLSSIGTWIYDVRTGEELDLITEPLTTDMRLSPDGKTLAAASDGSVYLWDIHTNKLKSVLVGDTKWNPFVSIQPYRRNPCERKLGQRSSTVGCPHR